MGTPTNKKTLPADSIEEVRQFDAVRRELMAFMEKHNKVFEQFRSLAGEYNQSLEAAEKAVKAKQVNCGPFQILSIATTYNCDKLYEEIGPKEFARLGGTTETVVTHVMDKATIEAAIVRKDIPDEIADQVKNIQTRYKRLPVITLP